jgi:hypothetical protein
MNLVEEAIMGKPKLGMSPIIEISPNKHFHLDKARQKNNLFGVGIKPRVLCVLTTHSTTVLHP